MRGNPPAGKILIKDTIADIFLQQVLTRPTEFDVVATMNLNGDYISDALAAQGALVTYDDIVLHLVGADFGMMDPGHGLKQPRQRNAR